EAERQARRNRPLILREQRNDIGADFTLRAKVVYPIVPVRARIRFSGCGAREVLVPVDVCVATGIPVIDVIDRALNAGSGLEGMAADRSEDVVVVHVRKGTLGSV